jgi:hypothetical protein
MYYFTFECLLVQNVAWNQYVLLYFWLFTGTECCLESVCNMYYFTFDSSLFDGRECCLESVCIILILSVWWYRMLPGISMYYFTFECLMVQNVAWNQYVLFYFWVFTGTECWLIPGNILYHQTLKSKIIHTDSRQHSVPSNTQK